MYDRLLRRFNFLTLNQRYSSVIMTKTPRNMSLARYILSIITILHFAVTFSKGQQFVGQAFNNSMPGVPGAEITFWNIFDANKKNTSLLNYQNFGKNGARQDPKKVQKAVIIIHGLGQDPGTYMANMLSALAQANSANPIVHNDNIAIVAPFFANGDNKGVGYPWTAGLNAGQGSTSQALVWKGAQWASGQNNQYPYKQTTVSSYDVLDQMTMYFANKSIYPNLKSIVIAGHSLGGQTVNRYAAVGKNLGLSVPIRYWIGNPNDYLWFNSTSRPATLTPSTCNVFDDWRSGLSNYTPTYGASLVSAGVQAVLNNFQSKSKIYAKGTLDFGDDSSTCAPYTVGQNRNERFFEQIKFFPPTGLDNVDYVMTGHDGGAMFASTAGQYRFFFDNLDGSGSRHLDFGDRQQIGDSPNPDPRNAEPLPVSGTGAAEMKYQGCWVDASSDASGHALPNLVMSSNSLTIVSCTSACSSAGYVISGMLNGNQCFCGNSLSSQSVRVVDKGCETNCPGDSTGTENCGGPSRLSLWSTSQPTMRPKPISPAMVKSFNFTGCFIDNGSNRQLNATQTSSNSMTLEQCAQQCSSYQYMGLEYSSQCFCSNSLQNSTAIASQYDCNYVCSGNDSEVCGGSNRLSLYNNTNVTSAPSNSPPSNSGGAIQGSYVYPTGYKGCYTDSGSRSLSLFAYSNINSTVEMCSAACTASGFQIAGMEYGQECWCGSELASNAMNVTDSDCNMPCPGNSTEICGSGNRLSVYSNLSTLPQAKAPQTVNGTGNYNFIGCYSEPLNGGRLLGTGANGGSVDICASSCAGYQFFGVEYGSQCFCGNNLGQDPVAAPLSDCNMPCSNDPTQLCGAGNRLGIYQSNSTTTSSSSGNTAPTSTSMISSVAISTSSSTVSSPTSSSSSTSTSSASATPTGPSLIQRHYQGCYREPSNGARALPTKIDIPSGTTVESCQAKCSSAGFSVAGVEYGNECWCANALSAGSTLIPNDVQQCNMPCAGDPSELCGSGNLLLVYSSSPVIILSPPSHPPIIDGYSLFGCVADNVNGKGRTLFDARPSLGNSNSLESCAKACSSYQFFGTEYSNECYCGNTLASQYTNTTLDQCNMLCSGNASEFCGAGNFLSVYMKNGNENDTQDITTSTTSVVSSSSISISTSTSSSTSTSTITSISTTVSSTVVSSTTTSTFSSSSALPTGFIALGCFSDSSSRTLGTFAYSGPANSPSQCTQTCQSKGFKYAGVEYGSECWCDNFISNDGAKEDSSQTGCSMTCSGDSTQKCGGANKLNIYQDTNWRPSIQTIRKSGSWNFTDCFVDSVNPRSLNVTVSVPIGGSKLTVQACLDACKKQNLTVCGLEYGGECYGTQTMPFSIQPAPGNNPDPLTRGCSMPCNGNSTQACGGPSRLSVYTLVPDWSE